MNQVSKTVVTLGLVIAVVASALALVSVRQLNRVEFYEVRKLEKQRDALSIEWRQLLAEYSTWRLEHNIEKEARGERDMNAPEGQRIQTINLSLNKKEASQ